MFSILGQISAIETIAEGSGIRDRPRLEKVYGIGKIEHKIKRFNMSKGHE